jgi:ADP-heptose:LPS heptosyltransferase
MGVDTLRFLDRFIGLPLCWAFTVLRWLGRRLRTSKPLPAPRKVLIIKLSEMGSTVLAYPALVELRSRCPEAELFFLVFKNNSAIVDVLDIIPPANIITVEMSSPWLLCASGARAFRRLWRARIDTAIDMDFFSRFSALVSFLVCRGNRVGFHRYNDEGLSRGNLLTHRLVFSPHVHSAIAFVALIRTLFEDPENEPHYRGHIAVHELVLPKYSPLPEEVRSIVTKLSSAGVPPDTQTLILINPNSSDIFPLRRWPLANFAELCDALLKFFPASYLVITGVASEAKDAHYLKTRAPDPRLIDFTGQTTFRELLALYSIAKVIVTNDSGPAHFASLLELPAVVLFGPETPRLYGPLGIKHKTLYAHFACSPCVSPYNAKKSPCPESLCLKAIPVDAVLKEISALLEGEDSPAGGFRI